MADYPIIDQKSLPKAQRGGLLSLGSRSRPPSDLPLPNPHEIVVYKSGGSYIVDDGQSRADDAHIVNATSISLVNMRVDAPVTAHVAIPSASAGEFTVQVIFWCTVKKPEEVVETGLKDMKEPLTQYLIRHQPLFHIGEKSKLDQINAIRRNVTAEVKAYVSARPPHFRGMEVKLGNIQVLTPEELAAFYRKLDEQELAGKLTSEEQRLQHDLAAQRQELEEIRRQHAEEHELQRRHHDQRMAEVRQEYEQRLSERQLMHDQLQRSTKFEHAINETHRLKDAIGADHDEIPTLLAASAGEQNIADTAAQLSQDRQRKHEQKDADELRKATWAREDAHFDRQLAREDAQLQSNIRLEELKAQVEILKAGVARGLADHQTIEKLMGVVSSAVKELESAASSATKPTAGPAQDSSSEGRAATSETSTPDKAAADESIIEAEIVSNTTDREANPAGSQARAFREEDLGRR